MGQVAAWAVHLLTASGAGLGLAAAIAAAQEEWQIAFLCLGAALAIDGVDGPLARRARVTERVSWFDGAAVDFVVDFTNYVFIPAYIIAESGLLSGPLAVLCGIVITVTGALYFGDTRMKTTAFGFRGFPVMWNAVAYLLMIYRPDEPFTVLVIVGLAVLTFLPVEFVHPVRVRRWRLLTLAVTFVWAVLAALALAAELEPGPVVAVAFLAVSLYLAVIGFVLQMTQRPRI